MELWKELEQLRSALRLPVFSQPQECSSAGKPTSRWVSAGATLHFPRLALLLKSVWWQEGHSGEHTHTEQKPGGLYQMDLIHSPSSAQKRQVLSSPAWCRREEWEHTHTRHRAHRWLENLHGNVASLFVSIPLIQDK